MVNKTVAKICAFGYCLTDEQFHILEKEDILINPQGHFHLTDRKGSQGLVLPYKYEDFKKYPTFPAVASKIYALLQDEDTVVAGHATMNDVKYLNLESTRFSLPPLHFRFADTQFLYMNKIGEFSRQFGLGAIAQELGVEFTPHRAVDDAYATMKIAEAMCKAEGVNFVELLQKYEITLGETKNLETTQNTSVGYEKHLAEVARRKEEREKNRADFARFFDREKRKRAKEGKLKGKTVCFSHPLVNDAKRAKELLSQALAAGAFYTFRAEECTLYVCEAGETGARMQSVTARGGRVLTVEEFEAYLEV